MKAISLHRVQRFGESIPIIEKFLMKVDLLINIFGNILLPEFRRPMHDLFSKDNQFISEVFLSAPPQFSRYSILLNSLMKMARPKGKSREIPIREPFISEEDQKYSPIFKTIYRRIRNLNKKLNNIDALAEQDPANLNDQQLKKINSREEVERQIEKNIDFAHFYKGILIENGRIEYDNSQELMQIATLIAVGQHIDRLKNGQDDQILNKVYSEFYSNLRQHPNPQKSISKQIAGHFQILSEFLKNRIYYQACQDYISYKATKNPNDLIVTPEPAKQKIQKEIAKEEQKITTEKQEISTQKEKSARSQLKDQKIQERASSIHKDDEIEKKSSQKIQQTINKEDSKQKQKDLGMQQVKKKKKKQRQKHKRNERNSPKQEKTKVQYKEKALNNNRRKNSDTSLEPTPEKYK